MIHFSCDRCKAVLENPVDSAQNPMVDLRDAKKGVSTILPARLSPIGYTFIFVQLCEPCLSDLAAWKDSKHVPVSAVHDH